MKNWFFLWLLEMIMEFLDGCSISTNPNYFHNDQLESMITILTLQVSIFFGLQNKRKHVKVERILSFRSKMTTFELHGAK